MCHKDIVLFHFNIDQSLLKKTLYRGETLLGSCSVKIPVSRLIKTVSRYISSYERILKILQFRMLVNPLQGEQYLTANNDLQLLLYCKDRNSQTLAVNL